MTEPRDNCLVFVISVMVNESLTLNYSFLEIQRSVVVCRNTILSLIVGIYKLLIWVNIYGCAKFIDWFTKERLKSQCHMWPVSIIICSLNCTLCCTFYGQFLCAVSFESSFGVWIMCVGYKSFT